MGGVSHRARVRLFVSMQTIRPLLFLLALSLMAHVRAAEEPVRREWTVDGVVREALVYAPADAKTAPTPVIFAFHGHGGTMALRTEISFHALCRRLSWCIRKDCHDRQTHRSGGQEERLAIRRGDYGDRDLKFFDAILTSLRKDYRVDDKRIFVTGPLQRRRLHLLALGDARRPGQRRRAVRRGVAHPGKI